LEVLQCPEKTEPDLPGGAVQEQEEALAEEVVVGAEWEEHALGLEPVAIVSVPVVALGFPIK